jgi:Na+-translocating ferredoxin:NAD+ oxidoreductase RnfG subunit
MRQVVFHGLRVAVFAAIILLIHLQHKKLAATKPAHRGVEFDLAEVQAVLPQAAKLTALPDQQGMEILDADGKTLGIAVETSPASDHIIGFSGPTNVLLVFDANQELLAARILSSQDTLEHVEAVRKDREFLLSLEGRSWEELAGGELQVDAVSGATLTSIAVWESIVHRLGGQRPASLRFPDPVELEEIQPLFPQAASLGPRDGTYGQQDVFAGSGERVGSILRTSPAADGVLGYQGPTDVLLGFDADGQFIGMRIKTSFDNEEYVDYVREDEYFPSLFAGMTPRQLSELDLKAAGVEGVSGATMTSQAVANGLKLAAAESLRKPVMPAEKSSVPKLGFRDWGTILLVLSGMLIGFTNLRGKKWARVPFQILLIVYLGFINGDLVSQAVLAGWAKHGLAWRSAMGLVLLSMAAVLLPIVSKQNLYCHQLCPHGAFQQLLKNRLPWQVHLPRKLQLVFLAVPSVLLGVVVLVAMKGWAFGLVNLEPFDAYVFQVAGTATLAIFFAGLIASLFVPMAYCRYGCPTGALLNYLRFHGQSDRVTKRDALAMGLLALALILFVTAS